MNTIINLLIKSLAVFVAAYLIPGIKVENFFTAMVVAIVLGIINSLIRPIIIILTLPINIMTLGIFTLVINGTLIILTSKIVPGFLVSGFWVAVSFSIVLFIVNWFFNFISR